MNRVSAAIRGLHLVRCALPGRCGIFAFVFVDEYWEPGRIERHIVKFVTPTLREANTYVSSLCRGQAR